MRFKVKLPMFERVVSVYVGKEEHAKFLKDTSSKKPKHEVAGTCINESVYIKDSIDLTTIVHELYHVTTNITKMLGVKDDETKAYMQGYLLEQVCGKLDIYDITFHIGKD